MTIIKNPIIIKEITELELFSKEFSRLVEFMPNHPRTDWSVDIEIEFKNKTKRYMEINKSKDENGVMIQIYKNAWGGRLYIGMFRNDNLGLLIEHTIEKYNLNK